MNIVTLYQILCVIALKKKEGINHLTPSFILFTS